MPEAALWAGGPTAGGTGAWEHGEFSLAPQLPSSLAPMHSCSRTNLRVDFIEFGRNGLEDAIQRRADHRNNQGSDNDPLQDCITGMIS